MAQPSSPPVSSDRQWLGYCRVELSQLNFDHQLFETHRSDDERNVVRLINIFRTEGCRREDRDNYIKGVAGAEDIPSRYLLPNAPPDWTSVPCLQDLQIDCLNGLHRTLAARKYLQRTDRWWIVSLYSKGPKTAESLRVTEEFRNERAHTDGEIFRKIRQCHVEGDSQRESKWWARLSETKRKDLRQLLRDERYQNAFDSLLSWPGLWSPIRLGSLHRLLTMKCDEELLNYLHHIAAVWQSIFHSVSTNSQSETLDVQTVRQVEAMAPALSTTDRQTLETLFVSNKLFPAVTDAADRGILSNNLLSCSVLIPSLHTFFESLKYLEPCAKILRGLLPPKQRRSLRSALLSSFRRPQLIELQYGPEDSRSHRPSTLERDFELGYQQLWLYALRNFPHMTDATPRKDVGRPRPEPTRPCPSAWRRFAEVAAASGFKTAAGETLRQQESELVAARELFNRFRPYSQDDRGVREIAMILNQSSHQPLVPVCGLPSFTSHENIGVERRFGRPFQTDHEEDATFLYLPNMYRSPSPGPEITTFYCKWDMFRHFMGSDKMCAVDFSAERTLPYDADLPPELHSSHNCASCPSLLRQIEDLRTELAGRSADLQKAEEREQETARRIQTQRCEYEHSTNMQQSRIDHLNADHDHKLMTLRQTVERLQNESSGRDIEQELRSLQEKLSLSEASVVEGKRDIETKTAKISQLIDRLRTAEIRVRDCQENEGKALNHCEDFKKTADSCRKDMEDLLHKHAKEREADAKRFEQRIRLLEAALEQAKRNANRTLETPGTSRKRTREPDVAPATPNEPRTLKDLIEELSGSDTTYRIYPPHDKGEVCLIMRIALVLAPGLRQTDLMLTVQDARAFIEGLASSTDFRVDQYEYYVGLQAKRLLPSQTSFRSKRDAIDFIWSTWNEMQILLVVPHGGNTDSCPIGINDEYIGRWQRYGVTVRGARLAFSGTQHASASFGGKRRRLDDGEARRNAVTPPQNGEQDGTEQSRPTALVCNDQRLFGPHDTGSAMNPESQSSRNHRRPRSPESSEVAVTSE